ncbi:hypothetical protein SKAU_G00331040 [Synaphobranchus kaupii]|uniref:Uncharacterized protein n=1 Tax=Synaphobranchus kaupii TaxID=118154 RepID=A0A9Q1IGB0_SYNKA|nr:hypothetical protein SKAU_G00331040 [Synaphobranchus kaupii]
MASASGKRRFTADEVAEICTMRNDDNLILNMEEWKVEKKVKVKLYIRCKWNFLLTEKFFVLFRRSAFEDSSIQASVHWRTVTVMRPGD